jgi:hypothetical protein
MEHHARQFAPQGLARLNGLLYLILIALGLFSELFVRGRLVVAGDALRTAANIQAHEQLWRWNIAAGLLALICVIASLPIWVILLRPVSRELTLAAVIFGGVAAALDGSSALELVRALLPLGHADYLGAFTPAQLAALSRMDIAARAYGFGTSLALWGCWFPIVGFLIFQSGYLPKVLGVLYTLPGLGYLTNTFFLILAPGLASRVFPVVVGPTVALGEFSVCLWLLLKGIDAEGWKRRQDRDATEPQPGLAA